eukprot:TRINITY_DN4282_c0_g1_i2.p1 TRINITY_DN4282_c0_g1~~TRINITY_DN4282_c0_g1_i2.p1  ORF type:complete len:2179 (+),score=379.84 TRINITY_DN4282_c0_g1_i2:67-6603(+)
MKSHPVKRRQLFASLATMLFVVSSCTCQLPIHSNSSKKACGYTRDELLRMDPKVARDILLQLYDESCPVFHQNPIKAPEKDTNKPTIDNIHEKYLQEPLEYAKVPIENAYQTQDTSDDLQLEMAAWSARHNIANNTDAAPRNTTGKEKLPRVVYGPPDFSCESNLFAFNINNAALSLTNQDEGCYLAMIANVKFYDANYDQMAVCVNGILKFAGRDPNYNPQSFPNTIAAMIAAFWTDLDSTANSGFGAGRVYIEWIPTNTAYSAEYENLIRQNTYDDSFTASRIHLFTWYRIGTFPKVVYPYNTFQIAIVTNEEHYYAFIRYADYGIQWPPREEYRVPPFPQIGFNAGDGINGFSLPYSGTSFAEYVAFESNIGEPGIYLFHIGSNRLAPPEQNLFPFNINNAASFYTALDEACIIFTEKVRLFNVTHAELHVCANGLIGFGQNHDPGKNPIPFPVKDYPFIVPFWSDNDLRVNPIQHSGRVYTEKVPINSQYDQEYNARVRKLPGFEGFSASRILLATWLRVSRFYKDPDYVNTYQVAIVTNDTYYFTIFRYATNGIQWTLPTEWTTPPGMLEFNPQDGTGYIPYPRMGMNGGDGVQSFELPFSGTDEAYKVSMESNIGEPGVWVYEIGYDPLHGKEAVLSNLFPFNIFDSAPYFTGVDEYCQEFGTVGFTFYGKMIDTILVCNNGVLSLSMLNPGSRPFRFPFYDFPLIAPFWADVDTHTNVGGNSGRVFFERVPIDGDHDAVYYDIIKKIPDAPSNFRATNIYLFTWYKVGRYYQAERPFNTFQAAIVTDNAATFAILRYDFNGIQWDMTTTPSYTYPELGINAGDGVNFIRLPNSGTDKTASAVTDSNMNPAMPGIWAYRVDRLPLAATPKENNQTDSFIQFFKDMGGRNWANNRDWGDPIVMPLCYWYGISCDPSCTPESKDSNECPVIGVNLVGNNLRGKLSPSIVKSIQYFNLSDNKIEGELPDLQALRNLTTLDLSVNLFFGDLSRLLLPPSIVHLVLSDNMISGHIPEFDLPNLEILDLGYNQLVGATIPNLQSAPKLKEITLRTNNLIGTLPSFNHLEGLVVLDVNNNNLNGTIPVFLQTGMKILDLSGNFFEGTIPTLSLQDLVSFDVSDNNFEGSIPDLRFYPKLEFFYAGYNDLSGTLVDFEGPNLREIYVVNNRIRGELPNFSKMRNLQAMYLGQNLINGTLPNFQFMPNLLVLDSSNNRLGGTIPNFSNLKNLVRLSLNGNKLEGTIPDFREIHNLLFLSLHTNMLTGTVPLFSNLPQVIYLLIGNNKLSGTIPDFPNLKDVQFLHMQNNSLSGTIPQFSPVMLKIVDLYLNSNQLTGTIPNFKYISSLLNLRLSNNKLEGTIPDFSGIQNLKSFDASKNFLTGTLPSFSACLQLVSIDVSNNQLVSVTEQSLPSLEVFSISNNHLQGKLPELNDPALLIFDLSFNSLLDANLPQWAALKSLKRLDLYNCTSLRSHLPEGMDSYHEISQLNVANSSMAVNISQKIENMMGDSFFLEKYGNYNSTSVVVPSPGRMILEKILPVSLIPTDQYQIENITDTYRCPTISVRNPDILRPQIDIPPPYYEKVFCECLPGYFGFQGQCVECPSECDCPDGKTLRKCYPSPSVKNISKVFPCPNPNACQYQITKDNWIDLKNRMFEFPCEEGYDGRVCSKCADNFVMEGANCNECDTGFTVATTAMLILVVATGFFITVGTEWFGFLDFGSAQLDIFLFYTQVIQIITAVVKISVSSRVIRVMSSLVTLKLPSLECLQETDPSTLLAVNLMRIPLISGAGFIIYLFVRKTRPNIRDKIVSLIFIFLETSYFSVAADVLSVYGCTVQDEPLGKWFLTYYPWMQCYPVTPIYRDLLIATIPGVIFLFGYPVLLWRIAKVAGHEHYSNTHEPAGVIVEENDKNHHKRRSTQTITEEEPEDGSIGDILTYSVDLYKSVPVDTKRRKSSRHADIAAGVAASNVGPQQDSQTPAAEQNEEEIPPIFMDFVIIQSMNITAIYEKRCFWWVTVRIFQSLLFGFSVNVIPYTSPGVLYFTLFAWIQISILLQNIYSPYLQDSDDFLAVISFNVLYISFFCALLIEFLTDVEWIQYVIIGVNSLFVLYFLWTFVPVIKDKLSRKKDTQVIPKELDMKTIRNEELQERAVSRANAFEQARHRVENYVNEEAETHTPPERIL